MEKVYKFLEAGITLNNFNNFINFILVNHKIFNIIKKINGKINIKDFKVDIYKKNNLSEDNILLMYRILEKNFYKIIEKYNVRKLNYKDELAGNKSDNYYLVYLTNNEDSFNILKVFLLFYYVNIRLFDGKKYLGLDFEFNTKVVALMQINFEQINLDLFKQSFIFLFDPNQFSKNWKAILRDNILCYDNVYKILHGSDSLDTPFIYNELLEGDKDKIVKFNNYFIDTKFLCEYNYYSKDLPKGKCKIYYILQDIGVITEKKFKLILENEEKMGPIYDIIINVNTLSKHLIDYTLYDVLFLPYFVTKFESILEEYEMIVKMIQIVFLDKKNIIELYPKDEINKMNNYIVFIKKRYRLNDLFNKIIEQFKVEYKYLKYILSINYLKSTILMILKFEFYKLISINNKVYMKSSKDSKYLYDNRINNYKSYDEDNLHKLIKIFKSVILNYFTKLTSS